MRSASVTGLAMAIPFAFAVSPAVGNEIITYKYDALGRVVSVVSSTTSTVNAGKAHSICYDLAGNRSTYKSASNSVVATCAVVGSVGGPSGNSPPVPGADSISMPKCTEGSYNVVANDTDPDGNVPLSLVSVSAAYALVESATNIYIFAPSTGGTYNFTYVVQDSLGATATGQVTLSVTAALCN